MSAPKPEPCDLPPNWRDLDSIGSYYAAIGREVKAGEPVPEFLLSSPKAAP